MLFTGGIKPTTFNPYADPVHKELDQLQKIVNERPDLETVQQQLANLDETIRATIAIFTADNSSRAPWWATGRTAATSRPLASSVAKSIATCSPVVQRPLLSSGVQIVNELAPLFSAAGFRPNNSAPGKPPLPVGAPNDSQIRDDGALINLVNGKDGSPLDYSYDTGCHLPAAWRTAPPPPQMRPGNDPDLHYPYLYGSPGGRTRDAY